MKFSRILFVILTAVFGIIAFFVFFRWTRNRDSIELIPPPANVEYTRWELPEGAKARLGKGEINDIKFSPDGDRFAVATSIGVWLYDAQTGKEISLFKGDRQNIEAVTFSPDGSLLTGANTAGGIARWNANTGELRSIFVNEESRHLTSAVFSVDGTKLYSVGRVNDKKIHVQDIGDGTTPPIFSEVELDFDFKGGYNTFIALSPDRRFLAVSPQGQAKDVPFQVCDAGTGELLFAPTGHKHRQLTDLAFSSDGKTLASCNYASVHLWVTDDTTSQATFKAPGAGFSVLVFSPNGKLLASGCRDGSIRLWNATAKQEGFGGKIGQYLPMLILKQHKGEISTLAFSPDGKMLLSGSKDGTIRAWDTTTGKQQFTYREHLDGISDIAVSKEGNTLTSIYSWRKTQIQHWNIEKKHQQSVSYLSGFNSCETISPNATTLAMSSISEKELRLWDIPKRRTRAKLKGHGDLSNTLNVVYAFSLDEKMLATTPTRTQMGVIHLWDIGNPPRSFLKKIIFNSKMIRPLYKLEGHRGVIRVLAFSPDGKTLASAGDGAKINLWDLETQNIRFTFTGHKRDIRKLAFSPDGKTLASADYGTIFLWDLTTRKQLGKSSIEGGATVLRFSPDGKTLIGSRWNGKLYLFDSHTNGLLSTHTGHTGRVNALLFIEDGKTLVSGSRDGTILLWDWEKIRFGNK